MNANDTDRLVARVLSGELDAYAELVQAYQSDVWRVVAAMLLDTQKTEDLVQQTFVNAYRHLDRFEPGRDFGRWLKAIARNLVRQELRTRSREDRRHELYHRHLLVLCDDPGGKRASPGNKGSMNEPIPPASGRTGIISLALWILLMVVSASCAKQVGGAHSATGDNSVATVLNSNAVIRSVQVSPQLPPYRFVLTPDFADNDSPGNPRHIGRIDMSKENSKVMLQSIDVEGPHGSWFTQSFHTVDINFDGYLDFAVVYEVGGKWSSDSYWLFDPGSGRYITNALTAELRELMHNGLKLDPQKQEIRISLFIGVCLNSFEIFRIENGHLMLMESETHSPLDLGRCVVEKRKRIKGELVLIETTERQHEIPPPPREP